MDNITDKTVEKRLPPGLKPFVKGDPRINRKGRPVGALSVVDELRRQLNETAAGDPLKRRTLELLVRKLILKAVNEGDSSLIKDIIDRIDGKPKQSIEIDDGRVDETKLALRDLLKKMNDEK